MQVIGASKIFLCDEKFHILENGGIAFEKGKIKDLGDYQKLCMQYGGGEFFENSVLLPTFTNPHIHFEFSANHANFLYGSFDKWLDSVMQKREDVLNDNTKAIKEAIGQQLDSGVGSVGAISSYGDDMEILASCPLKVVFFHEALGSNAATLDFLHQNFLQRLEHSKALQSESFFPGIALHSPYSVHFVFAKKLLELARKENYPTSVHFLESSIEREWLEHSSGWFLEFFKKTLQAKNPRSLYEIEEFIELFLGLDTLFVHCLHATESEISKLTQTGYIITCPRSNRLLNNKLFPLQQAPIHKILFATDGKSSNNNLNFLEELRTALFAYANEDLENLAKNLLLSATRYGAESLRLNSGSLCKGLDADFSIFEIEQITQSKQAPLQFLLQAQKAKALFINGKKILG